MLLKLVFVHVITFSASIRHGLSVSQYCDKIPLNYIPEWQIFKSFFNFGICLHLGRWLCLWLQADFRSAQLSVYSPWASSHLRNPGHTPDAVHRWESPIFRSTNIPLTRTSHTWNIELIVWWTIIFPWREGSHGNRRKWRGGKAQKKNQQLLSIYFIWTLDLEVKMILMIKKGEFLTEFSFAWNVNIILFQNSHDKCLCLRMCICVCMYV